MTKSQCHALFCFLSKFVHSPRKQKIPQNGQKVIKLQSFLFGMPELVPNTATWGGGEEEDVLDQSSPTKRACHTEDACTFAVLTGCDWLARFRSPGISDINDWYWKSS